MPSSNRSGAASVAPDTSQAIDPIAIINGVAITKQMLDREVNVSRFNIVEPLPPLQGDDLERAGAMGHDGL